MHFRFLGVGAALRSPHRPTGLLINGRIMIDCGPNITRTLRALRIDPTEIDFLYVTHLHADHILGIADFLLENIIAKRTRPLQLAGPERLVEAVNDLLRIGYPQVDRIRFWTRLSIELLLITPGMPFRSNGLELLPFSVWHGSTPTFGVVITDGLNRCLYTADTEYNESLSGLVNGVSAVIADVTTPNTIIPGHMSLNHAVSLAKASGAPIFCVHRALEWEDVPAPSPPLYLPKDGDECCLIDGKCAL